MLIKNAMLFIDFRIYHIFIALSLVIQTKKKFDNSNLISMIVYIFKVKKEKKLSSSFFRSTSIKDNGCQRQRQKCIRSL